jgi:hypothetical protein
LLAAVAFAGERLRPVTPRIETATRAMPLTRFFFIVSPYLCRNRYAKIAFSPQVPWVMKLYN